MSTVAERETTAELLAAQQLEEAARFLDLEGWIVRRLRQCEREVTVNLEIIRDNGDAVMFRGVRVQHSGARGPYMGPLVFTKTMLPNEASMLASQRTWLSALWGLPFGGSSGVIGASLADLSEREIRLLTRAYIESMAGVIGPGRDVITPQRDGHAEVNSWVLGALGRIDREQLSAVTGKPSSLGGVEREQIAALFQRTLLGVVLREHEIELSGAKVAIAGFGMEGRWLASAIEGSGGNVVAVCDRSGAIFHRSRLEVKDVLQHVHDQDVVFGYPDASAISADEMMRLPVDVLVLTPGSELRGPTDARIVVEAGGDAAGSFGAGTTLVPGLLADGGLLYADYLEWRKNACGILSERELLRGLQGLVRKTWSEVWSHSRKHELTLKQSAMAMALARVAEALRMK